MPISLGWAAGDVSLAAYIQACLARKEREDPNVSALGAVMVSANLNCQLRYPFGELK